MDLIRSIYFLSALFLLPGCSGGGSSSGSGATGTASGSLEVTEKVSLPVGSTSGPYKVTVPDGAVSLTIMADGLDAGDIDIPTLTDPEGWNLLSDGFSSDPIGVNTTQFPGQSVVAFTVPHSKDYSFIPGEWSFSVTHYDSSDGAPRDVLIYTVIKGAPGTVIDTNIWLVGLSDYQGEGDPNLQALLDRYKTSIGSTGLTAGEMKIIELTDETAQRLTYVDIGSDANGNLQGDGLDELFRLSSKSDNNYINIFLVSNISQFGVLGIAGGIPGPQLLQGTSHSGIVVNTFGGLSYLTGDMIRVQGDTMAHELGHYLGLFHTTEWAGTQFDPLSDTPECSRAVYDSDGDGLVSSDECKTVDGPNLMFWSAASFAQEYFSPMQSEVVSLAPAVR